MITDCPTIADEGLFYLNGFDEEGLSVDGSELDRDDSEVEIVTDCAMDTEEENVDPDGFDELIPLSRVVGLTEMI